MGGEGKFNYQLSTPVRVWVYGSNIDEFRIKLRKNRPYNY